MSLRVALVCAGLMAAGCAPGEASSTAGSSEAADALRQCASGSLLPGIDVSYFQGNIDWSAVADVNRGNQSFAYIRSSDGLTHDPKFTQNWEGAAAAGLYRGAYHFFRSNEDPVEQANVLLDAIGGQIGPQDLPPVMDLEVTDGMSAYTISSRAATFVETVYAALGRKPLVYIGSGFAAEIGNPSTLAQYPLWVANWTTSCPSMPVRWSSWRFWQHRVATWGTIAGISEKIDLDYFNGTAADLAAYAGPNGAD